jgi:hypothetical protein
MARLSQFGPGAEAAPAAAAAAADEAHIAGSKECLKTRMRPVCLDG